MKSAKDSPSTSCMGVRAMSKTPVLRRSQALAIESRVALKPGDFNVPQMLRDDADEIEANLVEIGRKDKTIAELRSAIQDNADDALLALDYFGVEPAQCAREAMERLTSPAADARSSEFSRFIREAGPDEKAEVFERVIDDAVAEQSAAADRRGQCHVDNMPWCIECGAKSKDECSCGYREVKGFSAADRRGQQHLSTSEGDSDPKPTIEELERMLDEDGGSPEIQKDGSIKIVDGEPDNATPEVHDPDDVLPEKD